MKKAAKVGGVLGFLFASLFFAFALLSDPSIASAQNLGQIAIVFSVFTVAGSVVAIVLRAMWLLIKKLFGSGKTAVEAIAPEKTEAPSKGSSKWSKSALILLALVAAAFAFGYLEDSPIGRTWKVVKSGNSVNQIYARAQASNINNPPVMRFYCENSELHTLIEFGVPIKDSYQGTQYTLAKVTATVDSEPSTTIGFSFFQDNRSTLISTDHSSLSGGIKSLGVGIDNMIFNALGMKRHARISWNPEGLAWEMRFAKQVTLSAVTQSGQTAYATYNTSDFADAYNSFPSYCTNGSGIWP